MSKTIRAPFRMALRVEGKSYNAYYAKVGTMDDAILIGSLTMTLANNADNRREWQACMTKIFERDGKARSGIRRPHADGAGAAA